MSTALTSKELIAVGIKPGELFGRCLKECQTVEEALRLVETHSPKKTLHEKITLIPGTVWHWLCTNDCLKGMFSREIAGKIASNSEKRRWLEQKAVVINGLTPGPDEIIDSTITSLVFFHNGVSRCTML